MGINSEDTHVESKKEFMTAESRMVVTGEIPPSCRMNRSWVSRAQRGGYHCNAVLCTGTGYKNTHILAALSGMTV